ncbi:uncharacterized protein EDB93DRAFT_1171527 [Suillus bovinus]|uniref:uncharacterized protein n=1 Tax=Suillus bovinus TaxID=48563 RepID=UPI001B86B841|nr:uncharacterized protein EDB93DRAFT_1171527 [Suillus bovinus]KAG2135225.1 hypothetical protein EDB93DRAFT_1171527 [Suillus bovinus]
MSRHSQSWRFAHALVLCVCLGQGFIQFTSSRTSQTSLMHKIFHDALICTETQRTLCIVSTITVSLIDHILSLILPVSGKTNDIFYCTCPPFPALQLSEHCIEEKNDSGLSFSDPSLFKISMSFIKKTCHLTSSAP